MKSPLAGSWEQKLHFSNVLSKKKYSPFLQIDSMAENVVSITEHLSTQKFDLVINLPKRTSGGRRVSSFLATQGRVSVQGVKSLGGHFAFLCRGFEFYEVKKKFFCYYFSKRKWKYFYTFYHFYSEKSSKRAK